MSLHPPLPSAVLFVAQVRELTAFYRDVASMAIIHEEPGHAVLERDGFQLVVHALRGKPTSLLKSDGEINVREDSHVKLCLPVHRIADARSCAAALGGSIKPPEREWQARGFRACDGHDPEGNVFQVREAAT